MTELFIYTTELLPQIKVSLSSSFAEAQFSICALLILLCCSSSIMLASWIYYKLQVGCSN